jgi:hypothetical protein
MKLTRVIEWEMLQAASFRTANDPLYDISFIDGSTFDARITFTRAGAGATAFDVTGAIQNAAANVPRIGFDPVTHARLGLMMENARTNLFINSATPGARSIVVSVKPYALTFYGTGTITLSGAFSGALVGLGAFPTRSTLLFTPAAGTLTLTPSGTISNPQLEDSPYPTSYILTAGSAVTRSADSAFLASALFANRNAGSIAVEAMALQNTAAGTNQAWISLDDATTNNRLQLMTPASNSIIRTGANSNGVAIGSVDSVPMTRPALFKSALAGGGKAGSTISSFTNGVKTTASIFMTQAFPTALTRLGIGTGVAVAGCDGFIRRVRYWPRQLFDDELRAVTT